MAELTTASSLGTAMPSPCSSYTKSARIPATTPADAKLSKPSNGVKGNGYSDADCRSLLDTCVDNTMMSSYFRMFVNDDCSAYSDAVCAGWRKFLS